MYRRVVTLNDVSEVRTDSIVREMMMEAARTSETSVDNYFTRQYIPEDNSELHMIFCLQSSSYYSFYRVGYMAI
jgi:hypothetical protein